MPYVRSQLLADDGTTVLGQTQSDQHTALEFTDFFSTIGTELEYQSLLPDGETPNPETLQQFVFRQARQYLADIYNSVKARQAADEARLEVLNDPFVL
jgi:hypothetical protein